MGIEVAQTKKGINLSLRKCVLDFSEEARLLGLKPVETHIDPNVKLHADHREKLQNPKKYRRLVGKLNYLTISHSDISFAVSVVSQCFLLLVIHIRWLFGL